MCLGRHDLAVLGLGRCTTPLFQPRASCIIRDDNAMQFDVILLKYFLNINIVRLLFKFYILDLQLDIMVGSCRLRPRIGAIRTLQLIYLNILHFIIFIKIK